MSNKLETVTYNKTLLTSISQTIVCFHVTKNILNAFLCIPFSDFVIVCIHGSLLACSSKQFNFMIFFYHDHDLQSIFFSITCIIFYEHVILKLFFFLILYVKKSKQSTRVFANFFIPACFFL